MRTCYPFLLFLFSLPVAYGQMTVQLTANVAPSGNTKGTITLDKNHAFTVPSSLPPSSYAVSGTGVVTATLTFADDVGQFISIIYYGPTTGVVPLTPTAPVDFTKPFIGKQIEFSMSFTSTSPTGNNKQTITLTEWVPTSQWLFSRADIAGTLPTAYLPPGKLNLQINDVYSSGKIGIGTATSPLVERLTISGNLKLEGTGNGILFPDGSKLTAAPTLYWEQESVFRDITHIVNTNTGSVRIRSGVLELGATNEDSRSAAYLNFPNGVSLTTSSEHKNFTLSTRTGGFYIQSQMVGINAEPDASVALLVRGRTKDNSTLRVAPRQFSANGHYAQVQIGDAYNQVKTVWGEGMYVNSYGPIGIANADAKIPAYNTAKLYVKGSTATDGAILIEPVQFNAQGHYAQVQIGDQYSHIKNVWGEGLFINSTGPVCIGNSLATSPQSVKSCVKLYVDGKIGAKGVIVDLANWCDYVYSPGYLLPTIDSVATFIKNHHHLPNFPSEKEMLLKGADIEEVLKMQQRQLEEMMLYIIDLKKQLDEKK